MREEMKRHRCHDDDDGRRRMSGWEDNGEKREVIKKKERKRRVCAIMNYVYTCMMILFWLIFLGFMCRECRRLYDLLFDLCYGLSQPPAFRLSSTHPPEIGREGESESNGNGLARAHMVSFGIEKRTQTHTHKRMSSRTHGRLFCRSFHPRLIRRVAHELLYCVAATFTFFGAGGLMRSARYCM